MASIRKSFSFRNGVQVDEDNFVVNANGLVGIGTSVPSAFLDVRGTAKVVGLVTATDVFVSGVATMTDIKVGTAISITSGGIKATNFYGDGATLSNLPTSQWTDVNTGLAFTSIYAQGNVGIATTEPLQSFQVGGSPDVAGKYGVGINSIGNIKATGIITASSFVGSIAGPVTGDVVGNVTGNLTGNVTGNITGNVDGNINSTGISTLTRVTATAFAVGAALTSNSTGLSVSGVTTSTSFVGPITGDVTGNVTGNIAGDVTGDVNSGITTASTELNVGTGGTALTALNTGRVGVGSAIPNSDVTIRKESNTSVEIISDSGVPKVSIGYSVGAEKSTGILRFGNDLNTFDIINNDTGDLNFILDGDNNSGSGSIKFIDNTTERARITNDGKLGIAITNPAHQLHVVGTSTVTGNAFVGGNLSVGGTISGTLSLGNVIEGTNILTTSGISTFNQVNFTGSVGFNSATPATDVDFSGADTSFKTVGIGTTSGEGILDVRGIGYIEQLGINTTSLTTDPGFAVGRLQIHDTKIALFESGIKFDITSRQSQIGFGTAGDNPQGVVDLSKTGLTHPTPWFRLPELTTTRRNSLTNASASSGISTGAVIYNLTSKRIEAYIPPSNAGSSAQVSYWVGIATVV